MGEKGFTFVEVLVIMAIGSMILLGALLTIQQILVGTGRTNSQVVVLEEIHRIALQIKKDIQSHTTANLSDLKNGPTTFEWIDQSGFSSENSSYYTSIYSLSGTNLTRTMDNTTAILGRNVESVVFSDDGTHVNVAITVTGNIFPFRTETLSFSIGSRVNE